MKYDMRYEFARRLNEIGYPQKGQKEISIQWFADHREGEIYVNDDEWVVVPTLKEVGDWFKLDE